MKEFKHIDTLEIQHEMNEAIRNCLEREKIRIKPETSYDTALEYNYYELLRSFKQHLKNIIKCNKRT